jgi:hypothetical protein
VQQIYIDRLMQHREFFLERHSVLLQETILTFGYPIEIGENYSKWMVAVNIPTADITHQSRIAFLTIMLIGIVGVVLALVSIYLLTRRILKPLRQVNEHLYLLSQGQPNLCQDIAYIGKDEIAELVNYAHQLKYSILDTIHQAKAIASGDYNNEIKLLSEKDEFGLALSNMLLNLREAVKLTQEQDWLKTGQTELSNKVSGEQNIVTLAENIVNYLVPYLGAQVGAIYLLYDEETDQPYLKMVASHAYVWRKHAKHEFTYWRRFNWSSGIRTQGFCDCTAARGLFICANGFRWQYAETYCGDSFFIRRRFKRGIRNSDIKRLYAVAIRVFKSNQ